MATTTSDACLAGNHPRCFELHCACNMCNHNGTQRRVGRRPKPVVTLDRLLGTLDHTHTRP